MPLIVGVHGDRPEIADQFEENQIEFCNSYGFGVLAGMSAGFSEVDNPEEFCNRVLVTNEITGIFNKMPSWFDVEFCNTLKATNWFCNGGRKTHEQWLDWVAEFHPEVNLRVTRFVTVQGVLADK
tara:strand:- start:914 stop:1288 length:375 start_codon:yes stop_codon:yes gene_type:complete